MASQKKTTDGYVVTLTDDEKDVLRRWEDGRALLQECDMTQLTPLPDQNSARRLVRAVEKFVADHPAPVEATDEELLGPATPVASDDGTGLV